MISKEEFYEVVSETRKILQDPKNLECSCPKIKCEWHGKCLECVALHRYYKDHVPDCFQQIMNDKVKKVADLFEMQAQEKEKTPPEYWDYVKDRDRGNNKDI